MKDLRYRVGKRAEEIAVELGVAISTVRNWEQLKNVPRMTPMGFEKLMKVYQCTFEELLQARARSRTIRGLTRAHVAICYFLGADQLSGLPSDKASQRLLPNIFSLASSKTSIVAHNNSGDPHFLPNTE